MKGYIVCPCLPERYIFIPLKEKFMLDVGCVLGYKRPSVNEVYSFIREGCFGIQYRNINLYGVNSLFSFEIDTERLINSLKFASILDLWKEYMEADSKANLSEILSNTEKYF